MNNYNKFYNLTKLLSFNPDRQKGWNFYTWEYSPSLTIDLSLSFYHNVKAPYDINIHYINPKIGYLYIIQVTTNIGAKIYHYSNDATIRIGYFDTRIINKNYGTFYFVFLCTTGDGLSNDKIYLDLIFVSMMAITEREWWR